MVCESPSGLALGRAGCRLAAVSHRPDGQGRHGDVGRDGIHHGSEADDDGMNWNLHDLVYEALSEEWGRRDGEISDLWADDGPSGYQPPSYEPVNPERRTPQTPSDGLI